MSPASYRAAPPRAVVFTTLTTTSDKRKSSRTTPRGPPPGIADCPLPALRAGPGATARGAGKAAGAPRTTGRRPAPFSRRPMGRRPARGPPTPRRSSVALVAAHDHVPAGGGRLCRWPSQPRVGHADHAAHERHRATGRLAPARTPTGPRPRPVRELHRGHPGPSRTGALLRAPGRTGPGESIGMDHAEPSRPRALPEPRGTSSRRTPPGPRGTPRAKASPEPPTATWHGGRRRSTRGPSYESAW